MEELRTLLVAGHPELSERIHRLKGIEIIDEDDDPGCGHRRPQL